MRRESLALMRHARCAGGIAALAGLALSAVVTPLAAQQIAPSYGPALDRYTAVTLAEGVYAFIAPDSRSAFVTGNSLLVIGTESALVVDAGHFPTLTRKMIAEIKRLSAKPVRYLVNTHWHEDHIAGNADGKPIAPFSLEYNRNEINDLERVIPELAQIRVVPPTIAFDREMRVDLGGREVHLKWLGLGNTAGDAVVWVPDANVLATGDLVVAPTPYAFGSFIYEWPSTLRRVMSVPATTIIPGHGPVMKDWSYVAQVATLLDSLGAQMSRIVATTGSLDSARTRIDLHAFRTRLAGTDPYLQRAFDRLFVPAALERAFNEAMRRVPP